MRRPRRNAYRVTPAREKIKPACLLCDADGRDQVESPADVGVRGAAGPPERRGGKIYTVSHSVIVVVLLALAGFLIGGAFTTWKNNSRFLAAILGICAVLAVVGAVLWWR